MSTLTVCFSTHRPETLGLAAGIMQAHDVILLEEPSHPDFTKVLSGAIDLEEHLLACDMGYPVFTTAQYRLLRQLSRAGKVILQVEPYLEHLQEIQFFLAEDHAPEELERNTEKYAVYCAEREATGRLIDYYQAARGDDLDRMLRTMQAFAKADSARFALRDSLRAKRILQLLVRGKSTYVEAGSIHQLLYRLLDKNLVKGWILQQRSIEQEVRSLLGRKGSLLSPGDELTLGFIFAKDISPMRQELLCARALIYSRVVRKEERRSSDARFPHTENELESIAIVKRLSLHSCRTLFPQIRSLSPEEATAVAMEYCSNNCR
jgi:hypothetical protein